MALRHESPAETCALLNHAHAAAGLSRPLAPWASFNAADTTEGNGGAVSRYLGLPSTTTKHWQDAEAHFEDAVAMNARMGARPWLAHTHCDYARMLQARKSRGDRERAQELVDAARRMYRELGMKRYAARAAALAQEAGTTTLISSPARGLG